MISTYHPLNNLSTAKSAQEGSQNFYKKYQIYISYHAHRDKMQTWRTCGLIPLHPHHVDSLTRALLQCQQDQSGIQAWMSKEINTQLHTRYFDDLTLLLCRYPNMEDKKIEFQEVVSSLAEFHQLVSKTKILPLCTQLFERHN